MDLHQAARDLIRSQLYFSLATSHEDNVWIAPLWYVTDVQYNFYFVSDKDSLHAKHITQNPQVAFTIFDSTKKPLDVIGLQVEAQASIVSLLEIPAVLKHIFAKSGSESFKENLEHWNDPKTYWELTNLRIYKLVPQHVWILDVNSDEDNQRVEIQLT